MIAQRHGVSPGAIILAETLREFAFGAARLHDSRER
jgi:hypothetical protein